MGKKRDLTEVRREFEDGLSLTELSRKYGIPVGTLKSACSRGRWSERRLRRQFERLRETPEADAAPRAEVSLADGSGGPERMRRLVSKLLEKLEAEVDSLEDGDVQGLRQLAGVLKDLRSLTDCRDELDREEQMARIEKLRAEVRLRDTADTAVTVTFVDTEDCES